MGSAQYQLEDDASSGARLLPTLLPSRQTRPDMHRRLWNIGPADSWRWTTLDSAPTPTDQMLRALCGSGIYRQRWRLFACIRKVNLGHLARRNRHIQGR